MPKDFIQSKHNSNNLLVASRQQKQLSYFTESKVQDNVQLSYIEQWAERKYQTNDHFLNFVKSVFKTENFLLVYKYLRHPLPSARLVNDKIKTPLGRVFFSEDSFFKYEINGELVKHPKSLNIDDFDKQIFNALLFRHNDICVVDLNDINSPYKSLISIDNIVSIDSFNSVIRRIAYSAQVVIDEKVIRGVLYIDDKNYLFYEKEESGELSDTPTLTAPHDLGRCPADYISSEPFSSDNDVVRKSIFSYGREEMEEYVFLKTMQRMVDPNGAIPIVTQLDTGSANENKDGEGAPGEPMSAESIKNQNPVIKTGVDAQGGEMQTGSRVKVPLILKEDGSVDMDVVTNYLNFFYLPTEALKYLDDRIKDVKASIISNVIGDYSEGSTPEGSKSDSEINKVTIVSRQDKLRDLSMQLSRIRTRSDYNFLALQFGRDNVLNEAFYGSDFFLDTQKAIYDLIKVAPNPIEEKSLLIKSARNRNRFNQDNFTRDFILYHLIPYGNVDSFNKAVDKDQVGEITFQYQTRFNYWVGLFEAEFGDILTFWNILGGTENEKIVLINNLITEIIRDNYEKSGLSTSLSREGSPT